MLSSDIGDVRSYENVSRPGPPLKGSCGPDDGSRSVVGSGLVLCSYGIVSPALWDGPIVGLRDLRNESKRVQQATQDLLVGFVQRLEG